MSDNNSDLYMCLDLSSNKIEKIQGLDNLRKLETLLLANNRISVLEHMDALDELKVFNISNNNIDQRDNVTPTVLVFFCIRI